MEYGAMEADAVRQQQGEDRALQYCNYIFEIVLNVGTTFGFQAVHCSTTLSANTAFGATSRYIPSSIYVVADHLSRALLDDVAARLCITDKLPLDLAFREAVWTIHAKLQAGFVRWTQQLLLPMRPVCQQIIDPSTRYTDDSVIRLLLSEAALLLLLHTEASILQQLPSSCSLLYWLLRFSVHFKQAVESAPLLSQASVWAVPWNNRDMVLEVHTVAADLLSYVGQPALAEVEREWASRKDAARQVGRVLSNLVSRAAAGQLSHTLTAQEALRVVYVFSMSEAAVMLEEVLQPLQLLLLFLEAELQPGLWEKVCHNIESRLQHPSVLHKVLSSLSVVDCHCVADTFQALRDLGQHVDGTFDPQLAAVWWQEVLLCNGADTLAAEARQQLGTTWHVMCAAFLMVQGTFAVTISLKATKEVSVCRDPEHTRCISVTGLAWSSLLLSHAALRFIEAISTYYSVRRLANLPRLTDTLPDEICTAAQKKISHLPMIVPMGLKGVKDVGESHVDDVRTWKGSVVSRAQTTFHITADLLHSLWGAGIWFLTLAACFGLLFVSGTVGEVFEMAWWIIAVTHSCLVALTVVHDWYMWRQSPSARPLPSSFFNKARGFLRGLFWLGAVFGIPLVVLWLLSLPSHQALERIIWYRINHRQVKSASAHHTQAGGTAGGLVVLAVGTLSTNMLGGVVFLVLLSMAIRIALWARFSGLKIPLRSQTIGKWEELCGCFDQLAETWSAKCLPDRSTKEAVEEEPVTRPSAGRFPVVWNGLVDNLVQRDLLASSEGETLAYTRIINVTTPSLLSSLGLPDMMPPAFVVGPGLHQWLQQKANPTAVLTLPIVQVLRLLLLLMHHADVLTTGELIVMSLAVEEGKRVPKRQHVAIKHILVEGMKIISWAYKGGIQPDSDWMSMVKKHSRMTDAIFNYICAFDLGVAPSTATAGDHPPQSPTKGTSPREASAQHVGIPRTHTVDSAGSMHGRKSPPGRTLPTRQTGDEEGLQVMDSKQEAHEEAAKVTTLISKQLPVLRTSGDVNRDGADQGDTSDEPTTPACSEVEFGGAMYTPRSTGGESESSFTGTPRGSPEKSPRSKRKKKGQETAPPPPLIARLLRRIMGKSQYFMALSLYMVKLRRTPNWSKSEPEVPAAADELLSFMESVFHPAFADEPPLPALAAPSLTSVLPLLPDQMVVPFHMNPDKKAVGKQELQTAGDLYDPNAPLFTPQGRVSPHLDQLIKRHMPEWQNFQERIAGITGLFPVDVRPRSFVGGGRLQHLQWEFLMWVGQRSNSLAHQIQVLAAIHRATPTLLSAERPLSLAVGPKVYAMWLEAVADLKFQAMVLAPHLSAHIHSDDARHRWNAQAVAVLLNRYSFIRAVTEHTEVGPQQSGHSPHCPHPSFSVLLKGRHNSNTTSTPDDDIDPPMKSKRLTGTTSTELVAVYMVRLPINPYSTDLSSSPHPHSCPITSTVAQSAGLTSSRQMTPLVRPFIFTEYMQTCSVPMANLGLAPALLIRNMLNDLYCNDTFTNVFMGSITSVTVPVDPAPSVQLGEASSLRNWVTHSGGPFAPDTSCDVMSVSEVSMQDFATMGTPNPRTPAPGTATASPSVISLQRSPSIVSSSNFSLIMQGNQGNIINSINNNNIASQTGSPLSTPKFAGSQWAHRALETDTSSVARESCQGREEQLLQSREVSTPRSQISLADFRRCVRQSYDLETPTLLPPEAFTSPTSPDRTLDDQAMSANIITPRPFKLFERTISQGSHTPDPPTFSLPPPGPSVLDSVRSEPGSMFGRTESIKSKLPTLKTSAKPPAPLTPSTSFNRNKDIGLAPAQSSIASLRMAATASVSGITEPETATASVITINSAVPHYESSMHFVSQDNAPPVLSSAASVVEQRFILAAASSTSWMGFVAGQFIAQGTTSTRRYLAALANLLCLPAQVVGWQPAALCFVDKTWEMSHVATAAGKGVAVYSACGWICRYIMVDILGPNTLQEVTAILSQLLHGSGVAWLCQEGQEMALWLRKVLEMHVRATFWCVCLLPLFIGLRALVELTTIPSGWVRSMHSITPEFFHISDWGSESSTRTWAGLVLSLAGLLLAVPVLQMYVARQLHGWAAARQASADLFSSWLPVSVTLLASAITCSHSSVNLYDFTAAAADGTSGEMNENVVLGMRPSGAADHTAEGTEKATNEDNGLKTGAGVVPKSASGLSVDTLPIQPPSMPYFVSLYCRWGRPLWMTATWLVLLGALVLSVQGSPLHPMPFFTVVSAGIIPLLLGLLLLIVPHCLDPGCTWEVAHALASFRVWMQWMGESLGSSTQVRSWESMHDAYDAMWDPTVLAWLGQLVSLGLASAIMSWFGVQALRGLTWNAEAMSTTTTKHQDLLGKAFQPAESQSMFVGEIITRGVLVWAGQALLGLICSLLATKLLSSSKWATYKWVLSAVLALAPVALITACYFPILLAPAATLGSFAVLFILVACNAAAAGFITFVLGSVPHMLPWSAAQHICWLGDLWVGMACHVVWCILSLVIPVLDFITDKVQGAGAAVRCWSNRTSPVNDQMS